MPTRSLTTAVVARIRPPKQGQADHFDHGYPGLALRISYGGAKAWVYFYRLHGKLRRLSLGRFPGMTLTEAREAWRASRLAVSKGENPAHLRPTAADSFKATAAAWLERDQGQNRSAAEVRRTIERDVVPVWGERLVAAITRRDVTDLIDRVVDRGAVTMARRLHAHLHRLFKWAVGRGIIEINPMADLPKPGSAVKRDRVLTDAELAIVWKATKKIGWPFGSAVQLLALTAARRDEISSLSWSEISDDEIRIPGTRTKNGEPHTIPLSPTAAKLIAEFPRVGERVFSANGSGISGWSKAKRTLDAAAAEIAGATLTPWRLHDLRRTAATGMQRIGIALEAVENILGHVGGSRAGVVGIYQRFGFGPEQRAALEAWAAEIERIVAGKKAPVVHQAGALFAGEGGVDKTRFVAAADVRPVDHEWRTAILEADRTNNPEPLFPYLDRPEAQFGPNEIFLLKFLLQRMRFVHRKRGRSVPVGQQSQKQRHEIAAAFVRKVQKDNGLKRAAAIDAAVKAYPDWFQDDEGARLADFMRRGH